MEKGESIKLNLKYIPANVNSAMYSMKVKIFKQGTPIKWIKFWNILKQVFKDQGIKNNPIAKYVMAQTLLKGEALKQFKTKHTDLMEENKTNDVFLKCMKAIALQVFPKQALAKQKQYMHHYMCKPREMKVRELAASLNEMVKDLSYFPPFEENQTLLMDEIIDIFKVMIPKEWRNQMILQEIEVTKLKSLNKLMKFCKHLEVTEDLFTAQHKMAEQLIGWNAKASQKSGLQQGP